MIGRIVNPLKQTAALVQRRGMVRWLAVRYVRFIEQTVTQRSVLEGCTINVSL